MRPTPIAEQISAQFEHMTLNELATILYQHAVLKIDADCHYGGMILFVFEDGSGLELHEGKNEEDLMLFNIRVSTFNPKTQTTRTLN